MMQDTAGEEIFQDSGGDGYIISGAVESMIKGLGFEAVKGLSYLTRDLIAVTFIGHRDLMRRILFHERELAVSVDNPARSAEAIQVLMDDLGYSIGTHHNNYTAGSTNPSDIIAGVYKRTDKFAKLREPLYKWLHKAFGESYDQDTVDDLIECLVRAEVQKMIQSGVITETSDERGKTWTLSRDFLYRYITPNPAFSS